METSEEVDHTALNGSDQQRPALRYSTVGEQPSCRTPDRRQVDALLDISEEDFLKELEPHEYHCYSVWQEAVSEWICFLFFFCKACLLSAFIWFSWSMLITVLCHSSNMIFINFFFRFLCLSWIPFYIRHRLTLSFYKWLQYLWDLIYIQTFQQEDACIMMSAHLL